ncbi:FecR domain-containing protein [Pedobacter sp. ASV1-7]|uniref:FecR family protein n=1 Tax=Pedobacter sp. ASV1-7 TaxID=3145237 RepID=UPI0032E90EA1
MEDEIAKRLIKKYNEGSCTPEEKQLLESWYLKAASENEDELNELDYQNAKREIWAKISSERPVQVKKRLLVPAIAAAAILVLTVGIIFFVNQKYNKTELEVGALTVNKIEPGGNKAFLTLANGRKISLTDVENGELAEQLGIRINKTADGQLVYEVSAETSKTGTSGESVYNTIETPLGGQYQVKLNDGTKVWLNAGSRLRYPVLFAGNERKVELTGEGYFEVTHDQKKPFKVVSAEQTVVVLGTRFNVNNYQDEPAVKTTLLEGSVRVTTNQLTKLLKPGEQALQSGKDIKVTTVDVEQIMAWHKGDFAFEGVALKTIMRQISRWYNVDVVYQGEIADVEFGGSISRSKNITEVLKVLEMTQGVNFKLEGRRVLVMP